MTGIAHWRESAIITEANMDIHEEIDLQECPYCGGAGLLEEEHGWYVICVDCGSQTASIDFQTSSERLESARLEYWENPAEQCGRLRIIFEILEKSRVGVRI